MTILRTILRRLFGRVDPRLPVSRSEARVLLERLRHATEPLEPTAEPRWRVDLDRELHDEVLDELLGTRRRRKPP